MQPLSNMYKENLFSKYINDFVDTLRKNVVHVVFPCCSPNQGNMIEHRI